MKKPRHLHGNTWNAPENFVFINGFRYWRWQHNANGYPTTRWRGRYFLVSRLVLEHEVLGRPIRTGMCALHSCHDPACVSPGCLREGTKAENTLDMMNASRNNAKTKPHLIVRGERHGRHTKPEQTARGDRNGARLHPERIPRGERHGNAKLTVAGVVEIRRMYANGGETHKTLSIAYGVSPATIRNVVNRLIWRHV